MPRNIHWHTQQRKWMVRVVVNKRTMFGGMYENLADAMEAADSLRAYAHQLRRDKRLLPSCYCCGHAEHLPGRCTAEWRKWFCPCSP